MNPDTSLVQGVDFVFIAVADFEASTSFYGDVLGLECSATYDRIDGAEYETGSLTLQLISAEAIGREPKPSGGAIALHVDDVAKARAALEAKGVEFMGEILDSGVCLQTFFHDPDGNALILHNRYAPKH